MNAIDESVWCTSNGARALDAWFAIYDDHRLRRERPDDYHDELLRRADEMDRQGLVGWQQWRDLRTLADRSYLRAVAGDDFVAPAASYHGC
ncbi:hypothetical protein [Pseudomonas putida]|uniref:Uncharacterized protein n=1 Tax=Pseudomonas putida TaxID=303 RepID=A0A177SCX6_PSEPU|nr:hypothetical protein [Pseudomonas putida]OAI86129.1 hypothetical protein AYO28_00080 [Pseudomonas putida]